MPTLCKPIVGDWYRNFRGQSLEVVAVDDEDDTIEVQYADGAIEEIDVDSWESLEMQPVPGPDDWAGSFEQTEFHDQESNFGELDMLEERTWSGTLDDLD